MTDFPERDAAIALVSSNNRAWLAEAIECIERLPVGRKYIGEEIRLSLVMDGLSPPNHHNAWGALIRSAQSKRLIAKTGIHRHMSDKKSHGRLSPEYKRVLA